MTYLFKWVCALCHRKQVTQLKTGEKWPEVCDQCLHSAR
jgi:hypothetical protein